MFPCRAPLVPSSRGSYCSWMEATRHSDLQSLWGQTRIKPPVHQVAKEEDKWRIKGCPPRLLLQWGVCGAGGSSGPCSGAGDPSWSGWADWAPWNGATHQREAPRCRRWTLERHNRSWIISYSASSGTQECLQTHPSEWLGQSLPAGYTEDWSPSQTFSPGHLSV